jgi:uncharacterized protein (TIRG00374 family)
MIASAVKAVGARGRPLIGGVVAIVVIGVVFLVVLPSIAPWSDVWAAVNDLSWLWIVALAAVTVLNVATYAPPWMAVLPGLSFRSALTVTLTSTASTYVVPGGAFVGMGVSFAMLRSWGHRGRPVTTALTVVSIWNQFVIYGFPALALAMLTATGGANPLLNTLAWTGLVVVGVMVSAFAASLASDTLARGIGDLAADIASRALRVLHRGAVRWGGDSFVRFRRDTRGLLAARWHVITLATLVGHLTVWLVLVVSLRAMGVSGGEVSLVESFAAWSLIRVLGSIPIVPGGFGVVELGLTTALVGFGASNAEAVGAVMIYRVLTVAPPLLLGAAASATWRRGHHDAEEQPLANPEQAMRKA